MGGIEHGSVAWLASELLRGLLDEGVEVDVYYAGAPDGVPEEFRRRRAFRVIAEPVRWTWNRWYSRDRTVALITSFAARAWTQGRLSLRLRREHRRRGYDCVFQFSQTELLLLGVASRRLPPIVVQPSTTAAGELRWHRAESRYARQSESSVLHYVVRLYLRFRAGVQRRQLRKVRVVVGASDVFLDEIQTDYGIEPSRCRRLAHPVDLGYWGQVDRSIHGDGPATLLFPSRLSVRKGLELILGLSHRLDDLAGRVRIVILGGPSMWSDYSAHLDEMNPRVAQYVQHVPMSAMRSLYGQVEAVLAPSHFEPFSMVTAEALAAGVPVVASDRIGAAEGIDPAVCRMFPAGDLDRLEQRVRELLDELQVAGTREHLAEVARAEARAHFASPEIGRELVRILSQAGQVRGSHAPAPREREASA